MVPKYTETEFQRLFRISRKLVNHLTELFETSECYRNLDKQKTFPALHHILVWLWFAGHQECSYIELQDRFDISHGTAWNFVKRVSLFLSDLSAEHIRFPSAEEQRQTSRHILRAKGFPGVIGNINFY